MEVSTNAHAISAVLFTPRTFVSVHDPTTACYAGHMVYKPNHNVTAALKENWKLLQEEEERGL